MNLNTKNKEHNFDFSRKEDEMKKSVNQKICLFDNAIKKNQLRYK
jgi:hypothetical protein